MQALAQRIGSHQGFQLTDHMRMTPERKLRLGPVFHHARPELLQPGDLGLRERLEPEIGQRRAPPQRQRLAKHRRGAASSLRRQRPPPFPSEPFEQRHVDLFLRGLEQVGTLPRQHLLGS